MKQIESVKCGEIHENLSTVIRGTEESESKLIHEHYLVPARVKKANQFAICCISCDACYCDTCGRLIGYSQLA